jgi:hypothetical protein
MAENCARCGLKSEENWMRADPDATVTQIERKARFCFDRS